MKYIFFSILSALAFSCGPVAEAPKNQSLDCYVRFLAPESRIRAEATLREGTVAPQPVEIPGGIYYQKLAMKMPPLPGAGYLLEQSGDFKERHVFSWKDAGGRERRFEMQLSPVAEFGFGTDVLSRQRPATLRWTGEPLSRGEAIVLLWENAALGKTVPMEVLTTAGIPAIELPAAKIAELDAGQWTLYLVRKKLVKADLDGVPASGVIEYYSKTDTVWVK